MSDISFVAGQFKSFKAAVKFHLGKLGVDLNKDYVVQYDGQVLRLDGVDHSMPELRSAIKSGWLVLDGANVGDYVPVSAGLKIRAAQDGKSKQTPVTVSGEETYAGPATKAAAAKTASQTMTLDGGVKINNKTFNSALIKDTEGDGRTVGAAIRPTAAKATGTPSSEGTPVAKLKKSSKMSFSMDGSTPMNSEDSGEDVRSAVEHIATAKESPAESLEDAVVVTRVRTPSSQKVVLADANQAAQAISKIDSSPRTTLLAPAGKQDIVAASGDTVEEIMDALNPEDRARMLAEERKRNMAVAAQKGAVAPVETLAAPPAPPAPPVQAKSEIKAKPPASIEDAVINGDNLEIAPGIRWDKKLHWKTRVKLAVDQYRNSPEILDLIKKYEVPTVAAAIEAALR